MKPSRFFNLLVVILFVVVSSAIPGDVSATHTSQQITGYITGNGPYTEGYGECGKFSITFNPAGGPVTGTLQMTCPIINLDTGAKVGEQTMQVTLTGTFEGGDGGVVRGVVATGQVSWTFSITCDNCINGTKSMVGVVWGGNLYANGTGNGWFNSHDFLWNVTYSAQDFQAGLTAPIPTLASADDLKPHPAVDENLLDVINGASSEVVKAWPDLDTSITEILDQDDAIIARDDQGNYYVIDNQGVKRPLSADMQSNLQMNNEFGLLQNANLLWASPAVQAFVAANGEGALDAITGSGEYQYYTIPIWLQQRQYMKVSTRCGDGSCSAYTTISVLNSSMWFPQQAFASSEHSSIRGTINGGGDFIYVPQPALGVELASISLASPAMQQGARTQPYLGVQVQDTVDGADIQMVQTGSPAEQAGLLVGDLVTTVNGTPVDSQNPLAVLIGGYAGGDPVEVGVHRNGVVQTVQVTLASMLSPVIITPSAEITVTDNTEFVIDIGLNGATALLVLADTAHVREPVTGSEVDVPAGMAVIVLTGYAIGDPIPFGAGDINAWWQSPEPAATVQPQPAAGPDTPSPTTLFLIGLVTLCLCLVLSVVVVVIVIVTRKKRRPINPPDEKLESHGVGTRNKSGFWGTFAILCAVFACCILAGVGGLSLYNTNQSLVSGTATAYALYGPATATAASEMLTQAPGNPAMLAPDCAKIVASIQGLEPGDLAAYTSSLAGKWVINWRTRIEFIQSFPFAPVTGAYIVINAKTDDGCGMGIEFPEATKADFQANQYIHVSGQIRKINMISGIPTLEISLATSRINP